MRNRVHPARHPGPTPYNWNGGPKVQVKPGTQVLEQSQWTPLPRCKDEYKVTQKRQAQYPTSHSNAGVMWDRNQDCRAISVKQGHPNSNCLTASPPSSRPLSPIFVLFTRNHNAIRTKKLEDYRIYILILTIYQMFLPCLSPFPTYVLKCKAKILILVPDFLFLNSFSCGLPG